MENKIWDMVKQRFSNAKEVEIYREKVGKGLLTWEKKVIEKYFKVPDKILDIGCGGGREAIALYDLGFSVTGIDISESEIESAKATAQRLEKNIDYYVCDGKTLTFSNESFRYIGCVKKVL